MLQFTSVSIQSSFMKTRRVEGREILLAKVICTLIYIVKKSPEKLTIKACQSSSHLKLHNGEKCHVLSWNHVRIKVFHLWDFTPE